MIPIPAPSYCLRSSSGIAAFLALVLAIYVFSFSHASANTSRIKDIVTFEGVRENMLMGYGLVVGLPGTGDKLKDNDFTHTVVTICIKPA